MYDVDICTLSMNVSISFGLSVPLSAKKALEGGGQTKRGRERYGYIILDRYIGRGKLEIRI